MTQQSPQAPPFIQKWRCWLKHIRHDIFRLHHDRYLYHEIMALIKRNPQLPKSSVVYDWLSSNYATSAAIGIRRQCDSAPNVISLRRLLEDIAVHADSITRDWFVAQYPDALRSPYAHHDFDRFAPGGRGHVDPGRVRRDIDELKQRTDRVCRAVNKYLAHRDEQIALGKASGLVISWDEVGGAIDLLGELWKEYELLLNQQGWTTATPVIQEPWQRVFQVAWL